MKGRKAWTRLALVVTVVLCLTLVLCAFAPGAMAKRNVNPKVIPSHAMPYGMSYADWSAKWWQWVLAIPAVDSPFLDDSGANAAVGQSGPVYFLCGTMEYDWDGVARAERSVTVPHGKAIFLPIINGEMSMPEAWDDMTWDDIVAFCSGYIDLVTVKTLTVDGRTIWIGDSYRVATTPVEADAPTYTMPEGGVYPIMAGTYPFFSDGYWVMLAPLRAGAHTLALHGKAEGDGWTFETEVTYDITVVGH